MSDVVLVASGGGHLEQLKLLADRIPFDGERRWVTFDTPQSRSMLADECVHYVPYMGPRDYRGLAQNLRRSGSVSSRQNTTAIISTGSGLALAYLPVSAMKGIPTYYIESATRVVGPSLTGRILARTPNVNLYTQHEGWANGHWKFGGSVFEGFEAVAGSQKRSDKVRRVVVSLGTIRPYGFRRLVERLLAVFDTDVEVTWQTGSTNVDGLPIHARPEIPHDDFLQIISEADVLVAHAGTGIALTALRAGICPVLVPREAAYGEHIDNHQAQTAKMLSDAGLAVCRRVDDLTRADLESTAGRSVIEYRSADALTLSPSEAGRRRQALLRIFV